jgi:hypothetical protein
MCVRLQEEKEELKEKNSAGRCENRSNEMNFAYVLTIILTRAIM